MNVLVVIHYPVFGGPHMQALQLAAPLKREGIQLTVILPDQANAAARLHDGGVDVVTIPLHRVRATTRPRPLIELTRHLPREVAAIGEVIRDRAIDVVQLAGLVNPHAAFAGAREHKAVVWQLLDTRPPMPVRRVMMPLVVGLSDVIMTTGRGVAHVHPGAEAVGERLYPFFPPVDVDTLAPGAIDGRDARLSYGFEADDLVLVSVGNLNPQKGHEYLLQAVAFLRREGHRAKALIVGASHETHAVYERSLYKLCTEWELDVGRDVIFAGAVEDVRPALAAADIFVVSSVPRSEGVPTAAEEAMAMGLPVVSTNVGGVSELVVDGETGYVVAPLDARALAGAIGRLGGPSTRSEMGAKGRERAVSLCSREECVRTHVLAYERALEHHDTNRKRRWAPARAAEAEQT